LSKTQIQQSGGFLLPLLAAAAPFVAKTLSGLAVSSGAKTLYNKIRGKGYIMPWQVKK